MSPPLPTSPFPRSPLTAAFSSNFASNFASKFASRGISATSQLKTKIILNISVFHLAVFFY